MHSIWLTSGPYIVQSAGRFWVCCLCILSSQTCKTRYRRVRMSMTSASACLSIRWQGDTPLGVASGRGHEEVVIILLESRVDINATTPVFLLRKHLWGIVLWYMHEHEHNIHRKVDNEIAFTKCWVLPHLSSHSKNNVQISHFCSTFKHRIFDRNK